MSKEELKAALTAEGIKVDGRWSEERLQTEWDKLGKETLAEKVPEYSEAHLAIIKDELTGKNAQPIERLKEQLVANPNGDLQTPNGLIVPASVFTGRSKTDWTYRCEQLTDKCVISRIMYNGLTEFVREYEKSVHGEDYLALAKQFIAKKNA